MSVHPFSIDNIPFGVYSVAGQAPRCCSRIQDSIIDLAELCRTDSLDVDDVLRKKLAVAFDQPFLNSFASLGIAVIQQTRLAIQKLLASDHTTLPARCLLPCDNKIQLHMPMKVSEYTDFLTSKEHSLNAAAIIFKGQPERICLPPSFFIAPIGYHGRASSVVISDTPIKRPKNVAKNRQSGQVCYGPSQALDYEIEMAYFLCKSNQQGDPVPLQQAEDHIFGAVLLNDWSARDHQGFEMTPLGPFNGKNFGTSISPWIVTLDALKTARCPLPEREGQIAEHLDDEKQSGLDIVIKATINEHVVAQTYARYLYFSPAQLLAHHSVGGCPMQSGDLLATGTISGVTDDTLGSLMEASQGGSKPISLAKADDTRAYLHDGDTVCFSGVASNGVGFGSVKGTIVPANVV